MPRRFVKERKVPSKLDKVRALADKWFFLDLLGFHGGCQAFGKVHKELLEWYDTDERVSKRDLILMPRGHLKTTIVTVLEILHSIYVNPNIRIYVGSAGKALSRAIMREVVATLTDPWLQDNLWNDRPHIEGRLIPLMDKVAQKRRNYHQTDSMEFSEWDDDMMNQTEQTQDTEQTKKVMWTQEAIQVLRPYTLREPTVAVGSVDSPVTGFHYDKLMFDDIINFDNYDKPEKIERLDTWRNDMFSVLDDEYFDEDLYETLCSVTRNKKFKEVFKKLSFVGGDCTVVGTRYFRHDWYKSIIDDTESVYRKWVNNIYHNGHNNEEGYLWSERWNEEIETKKRKETSKKHFYAQYLNEVIVTEDQTLPFDKIQFIHASQISTRGGTIRVYIELTEGETKRTVEIVPMMVIDPAATCNKDSDFTALAVGGKDKDKNLYILDVRLIKASPDKWIREMYKLMEKWNLKSTYLETISFAVSLKDTIRQYYKEFYPISIRDYRPTQKASKKERIESGLEPLMSNNMLYMTTWCKSNNELVDQFNFFPSETVHDDGVDAVQMLNEVCKPTITNHDKQKVSVTHSNSKYGGVY
jgi:predicted phage terminase large subunit-like protein